MTTHLKISGFSDYNEREHRLLFDWKQRLEKTFRLFGFMGLIPRPVESTALLQSKGGIGHQIYTLGRLQDGQMTDLALPFDRTVPLAVYIAMHKQDLAYPFKRFDISYSFRGERPQAGRSRGFLQADLDVVDYHLSQLAEVECLQAMILSLQELSIPPFTVYLNHISIAKALMRKMGISEDLMAEALRIVDKLDKIGLEQGHRELQTLCPDLQLDLLPHLTFKGTLEDFPVDLPELALLKDLFSLLPQELFRFCPGMVRGLDYYTGLIFETLLTEYPQFGSIASGGKYGKLVDTILQQETRLEGFGISIGLTRLFDVLRKEELLPADNIPQAEVAVVYREPSLQQQAGAVAKKLREQGLRTDLYLGQANLGKQLSYADKKGISLAFILMGQTFVIKDLKNSIQSDDISSLEEALSALLKKKL